MLHNLISLKYDTLIFKQVFQKLIFLIGQYHLSAINGQFSLFFIKKQTVKLEGVYLRRSRAAKQSLDAADKLHDREWLLKIVIGTTIQTLNKVKLRGLGSHHNYRNPLGRRIVAKLVEDVIAAYIRQHDIEDDKVRYHLRHLLKEISSAGEAKGLMT